MAAEGDLDPSFAGGVVTTTKAEELNATAIDAQGRIVVAGSGIINSSTLGDFAVLRFMPNGGLDPTFGVGGVAKFDFPSDPGHPRIDAAKAIAIDPQGRIVVAGVTHPFNATDDEYALLRVNSNGSLDTGFGSNGFVRTDVFSATDMANSVAIDSQGRILVGGTSLVGGDFDFSVVRYTASGDVDTSFSDDGRTNSDFTSKGGDDDEARAMTIDDQGRIVIAGFSRAAQAPNPRYDFALARLKPDGSQDASFGTNTDSFHRGQVTTTIPGGQDVANALAIDSQGRIIAAGDVYHFSGQNTLSDFALARYDPDGSLDTSFGDGGKVTTPFADGHDVAFAVGVDSQGRLVAAGWAVGGIGTTALARYRPSGALDEAFGGDGKVTAGGGLLASAMAFDAQDRIVVAGGTVSSDTSGVARFIGDSVPPAAPTIDSGPGNGSYGNDPKPTFRFSSEAGATFACGFDGTSAPSCAPPFSPTAALGDGDHTFSLRAIDRAGNISRATTRTFTVDTHKPEVEISGAGRVSTDGRRARAHLQLEVNEPVTLTCKIDKNKAKGCKSKYRTPKLRLGEHKLKVTATDRAGNRASRTKKIKILRRGG